MPLDRRVFRALAFLLLVLVFGTVGYRAVLPQAQWLESFYMTLISVTTVGFGEVIPGLSESAPGRILTMILMTFGVSILLYAVSMATAFFVEGELTNIIRRRKMDKEIAKLEKHFIVCGVGETGRHLVQELEKVGFPFLVIDADQAVIDKALVHHNFRYITGDATDEEVLVAAGIHRARGVASVLSSDKDNLFITFTVRQLNPDIRIVSRAIEPGLRDRLIRAGANGVVSPNHIGGLRMASELIRPSVVSFLDRMLRSHDSTWRFEEVKLVSGARAIGRTLGSLRIPERLGLPVLALTDPRDQVVYYPPQGTLLEEQSSLVVLAEPDQVGRLRQLIMTGD